MKLSQNQLKVVYFVTLALCFSPFFTPPIALACGIGFSLLGYQSQKLNNYTSIALQTSIVLMGFGMNLTQVISTSKSGFLETAVSVVLVMGVGYLLTKLLKVDSKIGLLISAGTAICGGSAIAAISGVSGAKKYQISFSLVVIFILNAVALFIFPLIGYHLNLSQEVFGHWAAIAIHDTSSVVGAGASYGSEALEIATTVKMVRALWIIPLGIGISLVTKNSSTKKVKLPLFMILFVAAIVVAHYFPQGQQIFKHLNWLGGKGMVAALFLIGSCISIPEAKKAGAKSFILGISLWFVIMIFSLVLLTVTH
ncbi:putative sulfate exporter family transporter [Labilibacter sediminis]|nr:putative sulfate exporter family transporter [Labilibacter sediminis]